MLRSSGSVSATIQRFLARLVAESIWRSEVTCGLWSLSTDYKHPGGSLPTDKNSDNADPVDPSYPVRLTELLYTVRTPVRTLTLEQVLDRPDSDGIPYHQTTIEVSVGRQQSGWRRCRNWWICTCVSRCGRISIRVSRGIVLVEHLQAEVVVLPRFVDTTCACCISCTDPRYGTDLSADRREQRENTVAFFLAQI